MWFYRLVGGLGVVWLMVCMTTPALAQTPFITPPAPKTVRLLIRLNVPFQPEGQLSRARILTQRAQIAASQRQFLHRFNPLSLNRQYQYIPYLAVTVEESAISQLTQWPGVAALEVDSFQTVQDTLESVPVIGADQAWAAGYRGAGWAVAVLDTGVEITHTALAGKVVAEACFSTTDGKAKSLCPNGQPQQLGAGAGVNCAPTIKDCEHGTHVAGIVAGVAPAAQLIAMQIFSRYDQADNCGSRGTPCVGTFASDQIAALEQIYTWRETFQIAAVNMSLGGGKFDTPCETDSRATIVNTLRSVNIAVVASAGNDSAPKVLTAPACISSVISVGATTLTDTIVSLSNSAQFLDFLAPGYQITSTIPGDTYGVKTGTSMAAPHVAAAWAILKSKQPTATIDQIYETLVNTGIMVTDGRNGLTKPRIHIHAALQPNVTLTTQISPTRLIPQRPFTYTIALKNTGLTPVNQVSLTATWPPNLMPLPPDSLAQNVTLQSGEALTFTYPVTLTVMQPAYSHLSQTLQVTAAQLSTRLTQTPTFSIAAYPAITVTKQADVSVAWVGKAITFTYWVTNTGNITLNSLIFHDAQFGNLDLGVSELAPTQAMGLTRPYQVTLKDLPWVITPSLTLDVFSVDLQNLVVTAPNASLYVGLPTYLPLVKP